MKICIIVATAFLCFQTTQTLAARDKARGCRNGKCKFKLNSRLRFLRDLSKSFYPGTNVIDITLSDLHNRKDGTFGTYDKQSSHGYDIPKAVCPKSDANIDMLPCPKPDKWNRIHCIDYYSLCDHEIQCPHGEDEDPTMCLFQTAVDQYMKKMMKEMYTLYKKTQEAVAAASRPNYSNYNYEQ